MQGNLIVYKASAGSGKTYTLAAEYIARLLAGDPEAFRHVLAVTFTNKATAEMKERILQRLWELGHAGGGFMEAIRERLPALTEDEIRERAAKALSAIIHDYDHFRVETIDSFFQSLLSNLAHELGLAASFKVEINDKDVIGKAVDRLMEQLPERPDVLSWVLSYIRERIDENKRWDITREVKQLAGNLLKEKLLLHGQELETALADGQRLREYRRTLQEMADEARDHMHNAAEQLDDEVRAQEGGYALFSRGSTLETYIGNILAGKPEEPKSTVLAYLSAPENWLRKADQKKAGLMELAERLRQTLLVVEDLRERGTKVVNSCELSIRHLNPLRLLGEIGKVMNDINEENNRFMLAKTPLLFSRLVGSDDASFVFEKAGTTFRHVMIDEFQDTSPLQWENFKKLLIENMATGNGCLLVGDAKQGIYRFRGGDWSIMERIAGEFRNGTPEIRNLGTNFRSDETVVRFNNRFFQAAAKLLDEQAAGNQEVEKLYADVCQESCGKPGGYVRIAIAPVRRTNSPAADASSEDAWCMEDDLATQIRRLHSEGVPYEEMAILVRYNRSAVGLLEHFAEACPDIPLVSDEAFLLSSSVAVQLLVHALRYLKDPTDTIARAYVAHRYQVGILREAITWQEVAERGDSLLPAAFTEQRNALCAMPLYELCERLIRLFDIGRIKGSDPYVAYFLDKVLSLAQDGPADIARFLDHWDEALSAKSIPSGKADGVHILTIHKAKGLAFHTVLLPHCDWDLEKDRRDDLLWCEPHQAPYDGLPLVPVTPGKAAIQSVYAHDYEQEHRARRIENLNLLYVAFTRARHNLLVWCKAKEAATTATTMGDVISQSLGQEKPTGDGDNIYIYEEGCPARTAPSAPLPDIQPEGQNPNPLEIRPETEEMAFGSYDARVTFRQSNSAKEFVGLLSGEASTPQAEYIGRGKLLHKLFSAIRTPADIDRAIDEMVATGILNGKADQEALRRFVRKRIAHPVVAPWFDGSWQLFNECTILSRDASGRPLARRPDRVMVGNGRTLVVDFKFGNPHPEHEEQVREYARLLSHMGHQGVEGYLWYVYSGEVKSVATEQGGTGKKAGTDRGSCPTAKRPSGFPTSY